MGSVGTKICKSSKMNRAHNQTEIRMFKKERQALLEISRKNKLCLNFEHSTVIKFWQQLGLKHIWIDDNQTIDTNCAKKIKQITVPKIRAQLGQKYARVQK